MKKIFEIVFDNRYNVIDEVYEFIDVNSHREKVYNLLKETRDGFTYHDLYECLCEVFDEAYLQERADELTAKANKDMRKYINLSDHKLSGNFNNIEYDYRYLKHAFDTGVFDTDFIGYDSELFTAMKNRLNNGEVSDDAETDRKILEDWYWDTFGTFGLTYNFSDELSDELYRLETDDEKVTELSA